METLKILVSGDVEGNFDKLLKRVAAVNKKAGPFDLLLCVGRFLGPNRAAEDVLALRAGSHVFPVATYIIPSVEDTQVRHS